MFKVKDIEKRRKRSNLNTELNIFCINRIRFRWKGKFGKWGRIALGKKAQFCLLLNFPA